MCMSGLKRVLITLKGWRLCLDNVNCWWFLRQAIVMWWQHHFLETWSVSNGSDELKHRRNFIWANPKSPEQLISVPQGHTFLFQTNCLFLKFPLCFLQSKNRVLKYPATIKTASLRFIFFLFLTVKLFPNQNKEILYLQYSQSHALSFVKCVSVLTF